MFWVVSMYALGAIYTLAGAAELAFERNGGDGHVLVVVGLSLACLGFFAHMLLGGVL